MPRATPAVIDRIEDGRRAVLLVGDEEVERVVDLHSLSSVLQSEPGQSQSPPIVEGLWLQVRFEGDRLVEAAVDLHQTRKRKERVEQKLDQLRRRGRRL